MAHGPQPLIVFTNHQIQEKKMNRLKRPLSEAQMPLILAGSALLVLVIIIGVFLTRGPNEEDRLMRLENAVSALEIRIQEMNQAVSRIRQQDDVIEMLTHKVNLIQDAVPERIDALEKQLANLQQQLVGSGGKTEAVPEKKTITKKEGDGDTSASQAAPPVKRPTTPKTRVDYHEVKAGETLYQISRRYDISVEEVRRLNNLEAGALIRPGQKLIVNGRSR